MCRTFTPHETLILSANNDRNNEGDPLPNGFKICHLNVRSVKNKTDELAILMNQHRIDVLTLSETWLHSSIQDVCIEIQGYKQHRLDRSVRNKKGGGLLVYVNEFYNSDNNKYAHLNLNNPNIELQFVEISKVNYKTSIIANVYRPPNGNQQDFLSDLTTALQEASAARYSDLYLLGDINLDHTPGMKSDITMSLENSLSSLGMIQQITCPPGKQRTRVP